MARGNAEKLRAAADRKHHAAIARATGALDALERDCTPVTFRGLAKSAGVSVDFLYRSASRAQIEQLRAERDSALPGALRGGQRNRNSDQCRARAHSANRRAQAAPSRRGQRLLAALAAAHGENPELRRPLGRPRRTPAA